MVSLPPRNIGYLTVYESATPKVRVGSVGDGGYVIVDGLTYDSMLSCGIETNIDFEKEFLQKNPSLECFAFDGTINGLPQEVERLTFVKKNIGTTNTDKTTNLHEYINPYSNIFLKMDIESYEFRWFETISQTQVVKFKQIVIEIHFPFSLENISHFDPEHLSPKRKTAMLQRLAQTHWLVHIHANNCCGTNFNLPNIFECTYVRKDVQPFSGYNTTPIPSNLDYPSVPLRPDISLNYRPFYFL